VRREGVGAWARVGSIQVRPLQQTAIGSACNDDIADQIDAENFILVTMERLEESASAKIPYLDAFVVRSGGQGVVVELHSIDG